MSKLNLSDIKLTIIIVNYNGAKFIKNCLDSVIRQKKFLNDVEIIVVDNASEDNSIQMLEQYTSDIALIKNKTNVGFSLAHNQLIPQLSSTYMWLVNNDTEFLHYDSDILTPILDYLDANDNVVGLSPRLLNTDLTLQPQGSSLDAWKFKSKKTKQVPFLSGAALFIRTEFFKKIEGFDSRLFFYNDDFDFAKQAKRHKKKLIYFPSIEVIHHGGLSTKFKPIDAVIAGYQGSVYLCKKFYPYPVFFLYYQIMKLLIKTRKFYYSISNLVKPNEWVAKLSKLEEQLKNDI